MEADPSLLSFNVALGVLLVDILLSGDNAIVIALVCRSLDERHRTKALWIGILGAFLARLVLTSCATLAMNLPLIKLVGGIFLLQISVELIVNNVNKSMDKKASQHGNAVDAFSAARTIILADIVMSLDNVLALSAITQNNWPMLVAGLLLSIPILMFGSFYISKLLDVSPYLLWVGGAILGGVSGALIIDDPIFDGALNNASSLSPIIVPVLAAGFVLQISRVIAANAKHMQTVTKPRPMFKIFWPSDADFLLAPTPSVDPRLSRADSQTNAHVQLAVLESASVVELPAKSADASAANAAPREAASPGDYRVVAALGLFMVLAGGAMYYMLNMVQPTEPERLVAYVCKQQSVTIGYVPGSKDIHLANAKVLINATVVEDRIVWGDYGAATVQLSLAPPVKIVSANARKLVVNGGAFENTTCFPTNQQ